MEKGFSQPSSTLPESNQFVVQDSQVESQQNSAADLPALQPMEEEGDNSSSEIVYPVMDASGGQSRPFVLVTDSEVEGTEAQPVSDNAQVVEETVSEDNPDPELTGTSNDEANVTVIARDGRSSKQTDDEQLSQDLFQAKDDDDPAPVATPSSHIPSLQLSAEPMLVPETVEESQGDQEICPSPEVYDNMPLIIPSTPTLPASQGQESEYNPAEVSTLASQPRQRAASQVQSQSSSQQLRAASQVQSQSSSQQLTSPSAIGHVMEGPTLAEGLQEWQDSQALSLHLTAGSSESQLSTQQQGGMSMQSVPASSGSARNRGVKGYVDELPQSQDIESQISTQRGASAFSQPSQTTKTKSSGAGSVQKVPSEPSGGLSSKEEHAGVTDRPFAAAAKSAMSIDMVQSESQSASETRFRLERPDTSGLDSQGDRAGRQAGGSTMNVFQRMSKGAKVTPKQPAAVLSEDSEDFFSQPDKQAVIDPTSDSDSIPCSQDRHQRRPYPRSQEKMEPLEKVEEEEEDNDPPMEIEEIFNVDTVLDSEPEEDDGTQSYEVFPALSRTASPIAKVKEHVEEAQVPALLPSITAAPPLSQSLSANGSVPPASQPSQPRHTPSIGSQPRSQSLLQGSDQREAGQTRPPSQPSQAAALSQPRGGGGVTASPQVGASQASAALRRSQNRSQERQEIVASQGKESSQPPSQPMAVLSLEASVKTKVGGGVVGGDGLGVSAAQQGERGSPDRRSRSQGAGASSADLYAFHGTQSQLPETDATAASRADTSVGTALTAKGRPKSMLGRRRKCLVKKKNEPNPKSEVDLKSSSASGDNSAAAIARGNTKPTRKVKRSEKFTKLQKTTDVFKTPEVDALRSSKKKDENLKDTPPGPHQSGAALHPSQPLASTSGAGEGRADSQRLGKRKSVEFSDTVQMSSFSPFSLEQSLSDSQSSDTVMEVTKVTEMVMRYVKRITEIRHIGNDGQVLHEKTSAEEGEHEVMQQTELKNTRRLPLPLSPSRSASTLTSGDLGDISSSSLTHAGSSLERAGSSLEFPYPRLSASLPSATSARLAGSTATNQPSSVPWRLSGNLSALASSLEHGEAPAANPSPAGSSMATAGVTSPPSAAVSFISPNLSSVHSDKAEKDDSRLDAVVTSSSSLRGSEPLYSADNLPSSDVPCAQVPPPATLSSSSSMASSPAVVVPPTTSGTAQQKKSPSVTPTSKSQRKSARRAPADSSQEESQQARKALTLESQTFQPGGSESGGFSMPLSGSRKKGSNSSLDSADRTLRQQVESTRSKRSAASVSSENESVEMAVSKQGSSPPLNTSPVTVATVSKLELGARLMCRWKDSFFYPAKFVGLNTGIGNKFKVVFEDGVEKTVRAVDLVMAQNLPLGQSVLVAGDDGICDPGIVVRHITDCEDFRQQGQVMYDVAMDNRSTKRCQRTSLLLSEDQAACLLSDEEYCATFGERDLALVNTADVSLDNVILGKRLRTKGSPAVGVPRISKPGTSAALSDQDDLDTSGQADLTPGPSTSNPPKDRSGNQGRSAQKASETKRSGRKRKLSPIATSTPTPSHSSNKAAREQGTPKKRVRESFSPLGGIEASPENQKRPVRKARVGLFENTKGPIPTNASLFRGYSFLLTHVDKLPSNLREERQQLQISSADSSAEDSTDDAALANAVPFDKDHLTAQIEGGGGTLFSHFSPFQVGKDKKLFLISDTYQRTLKYMQCLAANVPIVSHMWIKDSCEQNQLLDYKSYELPAGISLEKHKIMERVYNVSCLAGYRMVVTSTIQQYVEAWTSVLQVAQCKVLSKIPSNAVKSRAGVDVVVSDHTCEKATINRARQLGVPVVLSEWVIQCLINNQRLDYQAHPKYRHDYFADTARE